MTFLYFYIALNSFCVARIKICYFNAHNIEVKWRFFPDFFRFIEKRKMPSDSKKREQQRKKDAQKKRNQKIATVTSKDTNDEKPTNGTTNGVATNGAAVELTEEGNHIYRPNNKHNEIDSTKCDVIFFSFSIRNIVCKVGDGSTDQSRSACMYWFIGRASTIAWY